MAQDDVTTSVPPRQSPQRPIGRIVFWVLFGLAAVLLVVSIAILFVITRVYSVSTSTMENTVPAGGRVFLAPRSGTRPPDVALLPSPPQLSPPYPTSVTPCS